MIMSNIMPVKHTTSCVTASMMIAKFAALAVQVIFGNTVFG
jgi:hypothetical protein